LTRVGSLRIEYLDRCYRKLGLPAAEARSRAVFAYAAYRGLLQLAHEAPASLPTAWTSYAGLMKDVLLPASSTTARTKARPARGGRRPEA